MSNKNIWDLTLRLQQALDQNYDIVNMDTVLSVIAILEVTPITKEQLEDTRLAKYINQLRRRTKSNKLAFRSKTLVKKWREMCIPKQQPAAAAGVAPTAVTTTAPATTTTPAMSMLPSLSSHTQQQQQNQLQQQQTTTITSQQQQQQQQQYIVGGIDGRGVPPNMLVPPTTVTTSTNSANLTTMYNSNMNKEHNTSIPTTTKTNLKHQNNDVTHDHIHHDMVVDNDNSIGYGRGNVLQMRQYQQNTDIDSPTTTTKMQPTSFANIFKEGKRHQQNDYKQHNINNNNNSNNNNKTMLTTTTSSSPPTQHNRNHHLQHQHQHSMQQHDKFKTFLIDQSSSNSNSMKTISSSQQMQPEQIVIDIQDSNSSENFITIPSAAAPSSSSAVAIKSLSTNEKPMSYHVTAKATSPLVTTTSASFQLNYNENSNVNKSKRDKDKKRHKDRDLFSKENKQTEPLIVMIDDTSRSLSQSQQQQQNHHHQQQQQLHHQQQNQRAHKQDTMLDLNSAEDRTRLTLNPTASNMSEALSLSNSSMSSLFPNDTFGGTLSGRTHDYQTTKADCNHDDEKNKSSELTFAGKFLKHQQSNNSNTLSTSGDYPTLSGSSNNNDNANQMHTSYNATLQTASSSSIKSIDARTNCIQQQQQFLPFRDNITFDKQQQQQKIQQPSATTSENLKSTGGGVDTIDNITATSNSNMVKTEEKVPKKRGRKKGSKGVDSIIAKETSLSSQVLISSLSGCKKVKTTKELYAEMQNRKLGNQQQTNRNATSPVPVNNTTSSWTANSNTQVSQQQQQHQQVSRPASSCSEPSLNSPRTLDACSTNATVSTVATRSTPENFLVNSQPADSVSGDTITSDDYSQDSTVASSTRKRVRDFSIDSNSNSLLPNTIRDPITSDNSKKPIVPVAEDAATQQQPQHISVAQTLATLEKELHECVQKLPMMKTANGDNNDDVSFEDDIELYPCSCEIQEITIAQQSALQTQQEQMQGITLENEMSIDGDATAAAFYKQQHTDDKNVDSDQDMKSSSLQQFELQQIRGTHQTQQPSQQPSSATTIFAVENKKAIRRRTPKSIFDLDFDDDDDPLHSIMAEAAAIKNSSKQLMNDLENADKQNDQMLNNHLKSTTDATTAAASATIVDPHHGTSMHIDNNDDNDNEKLSATLNVPFIMPIYRVHEDANCTAKERFELQTQNITKFHVNALHNCFVPNVNGNWDYGGGEQHKIAATAAPSSTATQSTAAASASAVPMDGSNVVPKYGALVTENLCKDLRHVAYKKTKKQVQPQQPNKSKNTAINDVKQKYPEFLGIAPGVLIKKLIAVTPSSSSVAAGAKQKTVCTKCQRQRSAAMDIKKMASDTSSDTANEGQDCNELNSADGEITKTTTTSLPTPAIQSNESQIGIDDKTIGTELDGPDKLKHETCSTTMTTTATSRKRLHSGRKSNSYKTIEPSISENDDDDEIVHDDANNKGAITKMGNSEKRVVKRLKIAFNGDVTMQRQMYTIANEDDFANSCNNSNSGGEAGGSGGGVGGNCISGDSDNSSNCAASDNVDNGTDVVRNVKKRDIAEKAAPSFIATTTCNDVKTETQKTTATLTTTTTSKCVDERHKKPNKEDADSGRATTPSSLIATGDVTAVGCGAGADHNDEYDDNDDDEYDEYDDEEYNCTSKDYHHEIVARSSTNRSNNHIVLTIKKTPSKLNSPLQQPQQQQQQPSPTTPLTINTTAPLTMQQAAASDDDDDLQIIEEASSAICTPLLMTIPVSKASTTTALTAEQQQKQAIAAATRAASSLPWAVWNLSLEEMKRDTINVYCPSLFFPYEVYRREYKSAGTRKYDGYIFQNDHHDADVMLDNDVIADVENNEQQHHNNNNSNSHNSPNDKTNEQQQEAAAAAINDVNCNVVKNVSNNNNNNDCQCTTTAAILETTQQEPSNVNADTLSCNNIFEMPLIKEEVKSEEDDVIDNTIELIKLEVKSEEDDVIDNTIELIKLEMKSEEDDDIDDTIELAMENNDMLLSFNHIDPNDTIAPAPKPPLPSSTALPSVTMAAAGNSDGQLMMQLPPNENCDVYINMNKNNNNNNDNQNNINNNAYISSNNNTNNNNNNHNHNNIYNNEHDVSCNINNNNNEYDSYINNDNNMDDASDKNHHRNDEVNVHLIDNSNSYTTLRNSNEQQHYNLNRNIINNDSNSNYQRTSINIADNRYLNTSENHLYGHAATASTTATTTNTAAASASSLSPSSFATTDAATSIPIVEKKEYISGLRAVDIDVDDENGKNCGRIQQFKEWHQVLQLRSYNDELLTVLPYVVLE